MKQVVEPGSLFLWVGSDSASGEPVRVEISD